MTRSRTCLLYCVALLLARPAHAYIDPTAGSMMLQLVLGGLAGLGIAVRLTWRRIRALFRRDAGNLEKTPGRDGPEAPRGA